jgi:hypothetical protein
VPERKPFLLRIDSAVLDAVQRWANDDLRSLNAQIEFVLRDALRRVDRLPRQPVPEETTKTAPLDPARGALSESRRAKDREGHEEDD